MLKLTSTPPHFFIFLRSRNSHLGEDLFGEGGGGGGGEGEKEKVIMNIIIAARCFRGANCYDSHS